VDSDQGMRPFGYLPQSTEMVDVTVRDEDMRQRLPTNPLAEPLPCLGQALLELPIGSPETRADVDQRRDFVLDDEVCVTPQPRKYLQGNPIYAASACALVPLCSGRHDAPAPHSARSPRKKSSENASASSSEVSRPPSLYHVTVQFCTPRIPKTTTGTSTGR